MTDNTIFRKYLLFDSFGTPMTNIQLEDQNKNYDGFTFNLGDKTIRSRTAKKTPKKLGYFVSFWVKDNNGLNKAYDSLEFPNLLIINICDGINKGQFVFPKQILIDKKIITSLDINGKMAIRVYPKEEIALNKQAIKTYNWQKEYYVDFSIDNWEEKLKRLYKYI